MKKNTRFFGKQEILSLVLAAPIWLAGAYYGHSHIAKAWTACASRIHPVPAAQAAPEPQAPAVKPIELKPEIDTSATSESETLSEVVVVASNKAPKKRRVISDIERAQAFNLTPYCSSGCSN
jgi:hypothetical protein